MTVTSKIRTPGPWVYVPSTPQEGFECFWIMGGSGQHRVDIGSVHGPQTPEREATARLIAAAPEMYEALKRASNLINARLSQNAFNNGIEYNGMDEGDVQAGRILDEIREALRKAEG